jgi:hypothetical protein
MDAMSDYWNCVCEISKQRRKYFHNYMHYARLIKEAVELEDVEVIVLGSVVEGEHTMASDIDVLIIFDNVPQRLDDRAKILSKVNEVLGYLHPFELHLVTRKEAEWYRKRSKNCVKV